MDLTGMSPLERARHTQVCQKRPKNPERGQLTFPEITVAGIPRKAARSAGQAVRLRCIDCCVGSPIEVEKCPVSDCPNWIWRFGKKPETVHAKGKKVTG